MGKAEGWGELQPLDHEQCPSPCSGRSHPAWLLYLRLSACFLHEPLQAAAASPRALLQQSLEESCTCFPTCRVHICTPLPSPHGATGPLLMDHNSVLSYCPCWRLGTKEQRFSSWPCCDSWGSCGQSLGFSLLQFYYLKMGIGAGFALTCCQLLR